MADKVNVINVVKEKDQVYHQPADAMLTTFGPGLNWDIPIDREYKLGLLRSYVKELKAASPLKDGHVLVANGTPDVAPKYGKAIFVFDAFQTPLDLLVGAGLRRANAEGFKTIVMPLLRTGRQFKTEDSLAALARGVALFVDFGASNVKTINIVVRDNKAIADALEEKFSRAKEIESQNRPRIPRRV